MTLYDEQLLAAIAAEMGVRVVVARGYELQDDREAADSIGKNGHVSELETEKGQSYEQYRARN